MATALLNLSAVLFALLATTVFAQDNSGYATYSNNNGGVCSGASSGLPGVALNAAQFGGGAACGQCMQIQGTGNGAGQDPVSTAPYIAVVTNVCPQCAPGDIDLQESGNGKFGITWSFVACPGAGRRLIETEDSSEQLQGTVAEESAPSDGSSDLVEETEQSSGDAVQEEVPEQGASEEVQEEASAASPAAAEEEQPPQQLPASRKLLRGA